ncbi:hypothetical protein DESC_240077 [Desulfosarcina cetonica]|uniref:hypothetical protein n=1 Tax=Desulfosarcina cetonica TaxID=90730 RepID=UPI0006D28282|nr:hypothetical protein [Desulfosarcina cetonica]VTR64686.1 hypothetical protein DESC_240077 [Desulfosarcina cetonica]
MTPQLKNELVEGICLAAQMVMGAPESAALNQKLKDDPDLFAGMEKSLRWTERALNDCIAQGGVDIRFPGHEDYSFRLNVSLGGVQQALKMLDDMRSESQTA